MSERINKKKHLYQVTRIQHREREHLTYAGVAHCTNDLIYDYLTWCCVRALEESLSGSWEAVPAAGYPKVGVSLYARGGGNEKISFSAPSERITRVGG